MSLPEFVRVNGAELEILRSAIQTNGWVDKVPRNNVDHAQVAILEAARRLVDGALESGPDQSDAAQEWLAPWPAPTELASFYVMGLPAPQGSKTVVKAGKRHVAIEGSSDSGRRRLTSWQDAVTEAAARQSKRRANGLSLGPIEVPIRVDIAFRLPMPRSRPKRLQRAGHGPCTVKPDLDKLVRAVLDGLKQGGLIRDDSLVWSVSASKVEVIGWTGAAIVLTSDVPEVTPATT